MITHCRKRDITYEKPKVMGIINATPDSFSDGGRSYEENIELAYAMADAGVDIIDIGGESTRPGSLSVSAEEELMRIIPLIYRISHTTDVLISVDTSKTHVAEMALDAGADMINDINGLRAPGMMELAANRQVPAVIMHMYGEPLTLAKDTMGADYRESIMNFFRERKTAAEAAGLKEIIIDPGLGFGKTVEQNEDIVDHCSDYSLGLPVLIGASRKRFVRSLYPDVDPDEATDLVNRRALDAGANILRVHDYKRALELVRERS